jgi:HEAT repeat protein
MVDPDPKAIKFIMSELRDVNKETRRSAVMKLGMMGGETAVRTLIHIVGDWNEDLIVRGRAAQMLGIIGDPRAVDPLIRALNSPGYQAQLHAAEALGKLGNARAVPYLQDVANDPTRDRVRSAARDALKRLGHPDGARAASSTPIERLDRPAPPTDLPAAPADALPTPSPALQEAES